MRQRPTRGRETTPHGTATEPDAAGPGIPSGKCCPDWMAPNANRFSRAHSPDLESNDSSISHWRQFLRRPSSHTIHFGIRQESRSEQELDWTQKPAAQAPTKPGSYIGCKTPRNQWRSVDWVATGILLR